MKEKLKQFMKTKYFHIAVLVIIILMILFVFGVISIKYSVEGETNLPFNLNKVIAISSVEGIDNEDSENKWNIVVNQNNDIYLYITKNESYKDTEVIEEVLLDNFNMESIGNVGTKKLVKPDSNVDTTTFKNTDENVVENIQYIGDLSSDIKNMKISNQGGLIIFRYANTQIGQYLSNDDEEINHSELLKKLEINNDDLKFNITFDIIIKLKSGKKYKSNIKLELPTGNVVEEGTQSTEITDLKDCVFKRVSE